MGEHASLTAYGDAIPEPGDLIRLASAPIPGGHHVIFTNDDPEDDSIYQYLLDDDGAFLRPGALASGELLCDHLTSGDGIGAGVFMGSIPENLSYVRHTRTDYRFDLYLGAGDGETYVLTIYRHVWPGIPVEVEMLRTITGRFSPELVAHIDFEHDGKRYILGSVRRLPTGMNALEYTRMGIAAQVFTHSQGLDLGQTLRFIHDSFLMAFPYEWAPAETVTGRLEERLNAFTDATPRLSEYGPWIRDWYRSIRGEVLIHRIHGNVNLRQMWLDEDERWVIGGWAGDVRLPMEERARLGSPLEDLATLQRSLFWACEGNKMWCIKAMAAIFEGYGDPMMTALFSAFVLDRACEEAADHSSRPDGRPELPFEFLDWFRDNALPTRDTMSPSQFLRSAQ